MANKKISELPYINGGKISGNTLVPLVTYFSATTGDTVHTYVSDLKTYLTSGITASGNYLPLSGGTVSGGTIFTAGITANTISATTYQNLPPATFSGGTVTGPTIFTNGLTANTISATTYLNLPAGLTGQYLSLSGGTVSGTTYFTQGVSGSTVSATTFNFNTGFTGSTLVGQMNWNQDFGVPQVGMVGGNVVQKMGESVYAYVKNVDTSTLTKGEVVYAFGASGDKMSVKRASNTGDTTSSKTIGIVAESIAVNGLGYVITQGTIDGLNLGSYVDGDLVWLATTPGQFTKTKQYAPYHLVFVGVVQRANAGNGQLYVKPQNGYELEEIHDVMATGATYGDILVYSAYGSNDVWVSTKTLKGSYTITGNTNIGGGVTATTVSATTYQNLPTDVRVTGASYSNNTFTYTNNTGGTFNVLFNTVTGLTVNGNLTVTGTTSSGSISATTYQNLPTDVRVTGASYSNNTFTYTNNTGGTFNVLFNTLTGLTVNGNLTVTGNTNVRAFTGTTGYISGSGQNILTVIGSGNSTSSPIFRVQGSSGELFSVNDSLTGSLFSVNNISGLPVVEVFSDNTILWGSYQAPSLNTTTKVTLTAGTNTVYSIPTSAYTGAFYEYTLISTGTTGARAGQIMSIWSGSTAQFTETNTLDIGTTTGVTFTVAVSGNNAVLSSSATTTGWTLKTIIRSI